MWLVWVGIKEESKPMDNKGMMAVIMFVALGITAFIGIVLVDSLTSLYLES